MSEKISLALWPLWIPASELEDESLDLTGTPRRVGSSFSELLAGYAEGAEEALRAKFTLFPIHKEEDRGFVTIGPIEFSSLCAHHLLPFTGVAYVGYLPDRHLVGASKPARVVDHYARMLQNQERLTRQIARFIHEQADAKFTAVSLMASHSCMQCRGVKQGRSAMLTNFALPASAWEDSRELFHEFEESVRRLERG